MQELLLSSAISRFQQYKELGEQTFNQLQDGDLFRSLHEDANSLSVIVKHLCGNMLSRWTDFMTTDGEKVWRERDAEFENTIQTREEMMAKWEAGWACLFNALNNLTTEDLEKIIYIRGEALTVTDAIVRQLCHYGYHVGQIVFIGRLFAGQKWSSLSIPRGASKTYNDSLKSESKKNIPT